MSDPEAWINEIDAPTILRCTDRRFYLLRDWILRCGEPSKASNEFYEDDAVFRVSTTRCRGGKDYHLSSIVWRNDTHTTVSVIFIDQSSALACVLQ